MLGLKNIKKIYDLIWNWLFLLKNSNTKTSNTKTSNTKTSNTKTSKRKNLEFNMLRDHGINMLG